MVKGKIFNIQRYSVHDGPGVRTLMFLKGCPLRCQWCSNPEGISPRTQIMFLKEQCAGCGMCARECPEGIHSIDVADGVPVHSVDRSKDCTGCRRCVKVCLRNALTISGTDMTPEQAMDELRRDSMFYLTSGGGVTLGGGEVTMQHAFATEVLRRCKAEGMNTAIETCGMVSWDVLKNFLGLVDLFLYDIKHIDAELHREYTGHGNEEILANLERLLDAGARVIIRIPLLKGYNDQPDVLDRTMAYLSRMGKGKRLAGVELLPYHKLGAHKYARLGMAYAIEDDPSFTGEDLDRLEARLSKYDIPVRAVKH